MLLSRFAVCARACAAPFVLATLLSGCGGSSGSSLPSAGADSQLRGFAQPVAQLRGDSTSANELASGSIRPVCRRDVPDDQAVCLSYILTDKSRAPHAAGHPDISGYGPADLQAAYNLGSAINNAGGTVALVLWHGDPNLDADLAVYRSTFGLPPCRESTGCLKEINHEGGKKLPAGDPGIAIEESLDVDMVSANCPNCKIVYVEAFEPGAGQLEEAENTASKLAGVVAISNSWIAGPRPKEIKAPHFIQAFHHPGIAIVASAGDSGYANASPTDYNTVTSAVGTTLQKGGSGRGWMETAWSGTGSGCSAIVAPQQWQTNIEKQDHLTGCSMRVAGDVAYDANPGTGVAVYDSYGFGGWVVIGGTSVSSPALAGLYALSGHTAGIPAGLAYSHLSDFYDITSGTNGTCSPTWLCNAQPGYDAPSGVGSPNGVGGL
jgi:subtilase family serine protease